MSRFSSRTQVGVATRRHYALTAVAALCLTLAVPSQAGATTTFGANLGRPVNSSFTCGVYPPFNIPTGASSCTWETVTSALGTANESFLVPSGNGKVTHVRVKVGPTTGPMQVVVLRALRDPNAGPSGGAACCKEVAASAVFTPAANATTTIDTNFPVRNDKSPDPASGLYNFDQLALSVLQAGVPVPANDTGSFGGAGPVDNAYFPAWQQVGQERADGAGLEGYVILMNADWEEGPPPPLPPPTTAVTLARPAALVSRGRALLDIVCNLSTACAGGVELASAQPGTGAAAIAAKKKRRSYGKARFNISAGKTSRVRIKLNRRGKALLHKHKKAKVWASFDVTGATAVPAVRVTLKRK